MTTRLGSMEVGLEVGMMQVLRTQVGINREPREVMGNKHRDQQQEQVKERNEIERMILEPSEEHGQMHRKLSLGMEKVGIEDIQISHEEGSGCSTEEHGQQDGHKDRAQSMEEVEPGRRLDQHHPCSGIRHQKEVGLRATGTGGGAGMVGG